MSYELLEENPTTIGIPDPGALVSVLERRGVVETLKRSGPSAQAIGPDPRKPMHLVSLVSIEDDALGEELQVVWEINPNARLHENVALIEDGLREALVKAGAVHLKGCYSKNRDTEKLAVIQHKYLLNNLLFETFTSSMPSHLVAAFRAILSGSDGFNWRNLVCHGLVSDEEMRSPASILTWSLALALYFRPYNFANQANHSAHQDVNS